MYKNVWVKNEFVYFQEFGDSARARKMYEQDSESDEEELEPNPKLEQGNFFVSNKLSVVFPIKHFSSSSKESMLLKIGVRKYRLFQILFRNLLKLLDAK